MNRSIDFPIVSTRTNYGEKLHGFLWGKKKNGVLIHIHGTGANFYYNNTLLSRILETLTKFGYSLLSTNNNGSEIYNVWRGTRTTGAANEIFENCLNDIDAWIEVALQKGFKKIILCGHSLGTEKVVYYMSKGKYKDKVSGIILLGFSDSYGNQEKYLETRSEDYLKQALRMVENGNGEKLIPSNMLVHSGFLPKTAKSYVDFFSEDSELSTALPLRKGKDMARYKEIRVPILALIGDQEEFTIIPIKDAIKLLMSENKNAQVYQIEDCDHEFTNHEGDVCKYLEDFFKTKLQNKVSA